MIYRIQHITEYRYDELVPLCHNLAHLHPRDTSGQACRNWNIRFDPAPATFREYLDFFGNHVTWFSIQEPHQSLRIDSQSEADVSEFQLPPGYVGPGWQDARQFVAERREPAVLDARQYIHDSFYVPRSSELAEYAYPSFPPARPLLECTWDLTRRIHEEFKFDVRATSVGTPVLDVLKHRRGVCQDFAHLQIGCLRSLGIAARYVSGYVVTHPAAGQPRMTGADMSHAWVSVYFPDFGWIDFDPTNGKIPKNEHITVGWGRDYEDISPVRGVVVGGRRNAMSVAVDVQAVPAPANCCISSIRTFRSPASI